MIKSSPFSFVRFEHPDDKDYSLDIPYTLPAFEKHEAAFQFIVDGLDRPADQGIEVAISDVDGTLLAVFGPAITATVKSYRYKLPNLLTYSTFFFKQISIDGDATVFNETVNYDQFKQMLFDLGIDLSGEYIYSDVSTEITILADTTSISGIPTDFATFQLNEYWHKGYAAVTGDIAVDVPSCFTYCLILPDNSVMGYTNTFKQVDEKAYTSLVTYSCNESEFEFIYGDSPNIVRLPFILTKPQFPKRREVYRRSNGTQKIISALVEKEYELETEQMPEVFHEAFAIMLGHDSIVIANTNIRETSVEVIESDVYNPQWETDGVLFAKGKGKIKVATFSYANSNCS